MNKIINNRLYSILFIASISFPLMGQTEISLVTKGLTGPYYTQGLPKLIRKRHPNVEKIIIDLNNGRTIVVLKEGTPLDLAKFKKAVHEAGFKMSRDNPLYIKTHGTLESLGDKIIFRPVKSSYTLEIPTMVTPAIKQKIDQALKEHRIVILNAGICPRNIDDFEITSIESIE